MSKALYEGIVYFEGPLSRFGCRADEREIIFRTKSRFVTVAIGIVRGRARGLLRCKWLVLDAGGHVVAGELPVQGPIV